ncbi:hypothetical protein ONZ45_g10305 [Pleurotus djamor]|nr:hypothetical protein ONZ45_g10305 [Pleurotus djamor]
MSSSKQRYSLRNKPLARQPSSPLSSVNSHTPVPPMASEEQDDHRASELPGAFNGPDDDLPEEGNHTEPHELEDGSTHAPDPRETTVDTLSNEQINAIDLAHQNLSPEQQDLLNRRHENLNQNARESTETSRGEGPSNRVDKGKGVDPREYAGVPPADENANDDGFDSEWEEADPHVQARILAECKKLWFEEKRKKKTVPTSVPRVPNPPRAQEAPRATETPSNNILNEILSKLNNLEKDNENLRAELKATAEASNARILTASAKRMKPSAQIPENSALGKLLDSVPRILPPWDYHDDEGPKKSILKPLTPTEYSGSDDVTVVYRFISESVAYLEEGRVKTTARIRRLGSLLKGKAFNWYVREIANRASEMDILEFFKLLIDAHFPTDLMEATRVEIDRSYQGEKTVREYATALKQKYETLGTVSDIEQVARLWRGFKPYINGELYQNHLSPNSSTWDEVVETAEKIELIENAKAGKYSRRRPDKPSNNSNGSTSHQKPNNNNDRTHQSQNRSNPFKSHSKGHDKGGQGGQGSSQFKKPFEKTTYSSNNNNRTGSSSSNNARPSFNRNDRGGNKPSTSNYRQLTPKELDEARKNGLCFKCKGQGHEARDCPDANRVKSSGSRPPGLPSHSLGIDFERHEELADLREPLQDLAFCASMSFGEELESVFEYPEPSVSDEEILEDLEDEDADLPDLLSVSDSSEEQDPEPEKEKETNTPSASGLTIRELIEQQEVPENWSRPIRMLDFRRTALENLMNWIGDAREFPGDEKFYMGRAAANTRFLFWDEGDSYLLIDRKQDDREFRVPIDIVESEDFNLPYMYALELCREHGCEEAWANTYRAYQPKDLEAEALRLRLSDEGPYLGDDFSRTWEDPEDRFLVSASATEPGMLIVDDLYRRFTCKLPREWVRRFHFRPVAWYNRTIQKALWDLYIKTEKAEQEAIDEVEEICEGLAAYPDLLLHFAASISSSQFSQCTFRDLGKEVEVIEVNGQQVQRGTYPTLQRNSSAAKDASRAVPKPIVVNVKINGHPVRALIDSGSLGDFISTSIVDQLGLKTAELSTPLVLQMAVQGSRSKITRGCRVDMEYQSIREERYFDVTNIANYDIILGTPFLYQHEVTLGVNPARVVIGSNESKPLKGPEVSKIASRSAQIVEDNLEKAREHLRVYADDICKKAEDTPLPPLRAINHEIPLIDVDKKYPWRPARCPDALREQWDARWRAYTKSGRWVVSSAKNTVPVMCIYKPGTDILRSVVDTRDRNQNTYKMASPLPDIQMMLRRMIIFAYWSSMDGCEAYDHIRVILEHVERTAMTTPSGTAVSNVLQQGDCNGPATYQALMNYLFAEYIGVFMYVYLDDIIIFSATLEEHIKHCKIVIDILRREKLYLSQKKLKFLVNELNILGHVIDHDGIRMDPHKVDSVVNWKTPTNRDLLRGFLGAVGYLADNVEGIRIPMGILSNLTGDSVVFRWEFSHQRAFQQIKEKLQTWRDHRRKPLSYAKDAPPIWLITDGCCTGISGVVAQGDDWKTAKIAAFYSAKLNSAQQNYPVHEIEMLAGVESMLRNRDILQGAKFTWLTDHKGLIHLLNQKNLSGRQARWLEKISEFDYTPVYIPGTENVLSDTLSRMYSNEPKDVVRAASEYTYYDVVEGKSDDHVLVSASISPVLVGLEAMMASKPRRKAVKASEEAKDRVETSAEFAARMRGKRFVLHGPGERKEGGSIEKASSSTSKATKGTKGGSNGEEKIMIRIPARKVRALDQAPDDRVNTDTDHTDPGTTDPEEDNLEPPTVPLPPSLLDAASALNNGIDYHKELKSRYSEDPTFRDIVAKPSEYRNFEVQNDLLYLKQNGKSLLCIPKVLINGRSAREIIIAEAHSILAHLGYAKTLAYLREHVWWKEMVSDTQVYCDTCMTCKRSKPNNQRPYGLLHPLAVATRPWEAIGIDFVGPLPESKNRDTSFTSLTVVIDLLTAMVRLIPSRSNYTAKHVAELIFSEIYKLHGLPQAIVSDRDVLFTSRFWQHLHELIGTKLRMSSAYHPQSDGSTERANRTITQMIRQCISPDQKDWVARLPAIEFAINSSRSDSTGYAPFFLNYGRLPRSMIWTNPTPTEFPAVRVFAQKIKHAIMAAHDAVLSSRIKHVRDANKHRREAPFVKDDLVYLSTENIKFPKGLARKFLPKFIGPYKILTDFGNNTYQLALSSQLKRRGVHDNFHASLLRIHIPNDDRRFPGRLDTQIFDFEDPEPEWAVQEIKSHSGMGTDSIFEVSWKSGDVTWLPYHEVANLDALQDYLEVLDVENIKSLPRGSGSPPDDPQIHVSSIGMTSDMIFDAETKSKGKTVKDATYGDENTTIRKHAMKIFARYGKRTTSRSKTINTSVPPAFELHQSELNPHRICPSPPLLPPMSTSVSTSNKDPGLPPIAVLGVPKEESPCTSTSELTKDVDQLALEVCDSVSKLRLDTNPVVKDHHPATPPGEPSLPDQTPSVPATGEDMDVDQLPPAQSSQTIKHLNHDVDLSPLPLPYDIHPKRLEEWNLDRQPTLPTNICDLDVTDKRPWLASVVNTDTFDVTYLSVEQLWYSLHIDRHLRNNAHLEFYLNEKKYDDRYHRWALGWNKLNRQDTQARLATIVDGKVICPGPYGPGPTAFGLVDRRKHFKTIDDQDASWRKIRANKKPAGYKELPAEITPDTLAVAPPPKPEPGTFTPKQQPEKPKKKHDLPDRPRVDQPPPPPRHDNSALAPMAPASYPAPPMALPYPISNPAASMSIGDSVMMASMQQYILQLTSGRGVVDLNRPANEYAAASQPDPPPSSRAPSPTKRDRRDGRSAPYRKDHKKGKAPDDSSRRKGPRASSTKNSDSMNVDS